MLWKLIRSHLGPYAGAVTAVVVLQLVATITSLYLPSLNGQIIDEGVAKGDTGFIMRAGAIMLGVSLVNIVATVGVARNAAATSASVAQALADAKRQAEKPLLSCWLGDATVGEAREVLRDASIPTFRTPERYLLLVETGDEVLDYRQAVERYAGCRQVVVDGGEHGLRSFPEHLPQLFEFCGL